MNVVLYTLYLLRSSVFSFSDSSAFLICASAWSEEVLHLFQSEQNLGKKILTNPKSVRETFACTDLWVRCLWMRPSVSHFSPSESHFSVTSWQQRIKEPLNVLITKGERVLICLRELHFFKLICTIKVTPRVSGAEKKSLQLWNLTQAGKTAESGSSTISTLP